VFSTARCAAVVLSFFFAVSASDTLTDSSLGYSIVLPENWVKEKVDPAHHRFYDSSGTFQSLVALVRYDFGSDTVFSSPEEWTRANFIAYTLSILADPTCNLLFYDTATVRQNGVLWATEAMTEFYSWDSTVGDWVEYIRFTASGKYGYELYAIGPMADMDSNIVLYANIIENINLPISASVAHPGTGHRALRPWPTMARPPVNALGRKLCASGGMAASQIIITGRGYSWAPGNAGRLSLISSFSEKP
jgi:hypothetical protein